MRRVAAHLLWTPSEGFLSDRVATLDEGGRVVGVEEVADLDREAGVEFYGGVLVPAMCNAHCHLELSHLRGAIPPMEGGFVGFARKMRELRNVPRGGEAEFWDARMWAEGVGRVGDVCNGDSTFALKSGSRVSYYNYCELFGLGAVAEHARVLCAKARDMGLEAGVTPHSTYSLGREAFSEAVGDGGCGPLSIHFMESEAEAELYRKKGPLWDWYAEQGLEPDFLDYGGPAERIVAQVPAYREVMLVHGCCAGQRDVDLIMEHFTAPVTWVVCPSSNRRISGLEPPIDLLRKNGLRIAVGTDSLASNDTLSLVRELSLIRGVPLAEMLGWVCTEPRGLALIEGLDMERMAITQSTTSRRIA